MRIGKSSWDDYPKTPDSFRDTVRRAVQAQMQEREQEEAGKGRNRAEKIGDEDGEPFVWQQP